MQKITYLVFSIGFLALSVSCKSNGKSKDMGESISVDSLLQVRYQKLLEYPADSMAFPRSYTDSTKTIRKTPSKDWTSGFFPGNLWHLYQLTGDDAFKKKAATWTSFMESQKHNDGTHDMGFKIFCSFGEGLKITNDSSYAKVIVESAQTLATRFNENVGSLRSWDFNADEWEFPVIVDNMMNLELLFEATKITGDSTYYEMAVQHANTTLKNHVREDNSIYHVVVYDTISGAVKDKVTHQGFNAESSWSRGQGWGIYGFTMAYRYTRDTTYLNQAMATADFYLSQENFREDGIPYWDFHDPTIPDAVRDVSAATVVASAFYELDGYADNPKYLAYADRVVETLHSEEYILPEDVDGPFILDHSTGNWPKNDEMDDPIVYGDYYFLEALLRKQGE
ncbi:glycoside hydrolase family 88 protein [Pricia sp.]|uniref:glycoside hydrolase family 88 protein n=1 Tax=Pricia sp. TaxID=2268138 RepID=UPI0035947CE5